MSKDRRYMRLIQSSRWRELRHRKLSENPLCEKCSAEGIATPATEVHHIQPCECAVSEAEMSRLMFSWNNLMSLCHDCHSRTHVELHYHSRSAVMQRNADRTKRFADRFLSSPTETGGGFFSEGAGAPKSTDEVHTIFGENFGPWGLDGDFPGPFDNLTDKNS